MGRHKHYAFALIVSVSTLVTVLQVLQTHTQTGRKSLSCEMIAVKIHSTSAAATRRDLNDLPTSETGVRSTRRQIRTRNFTQMSFGPVYIFGAALGNSSNDKTLDLIKIYAMLNAHAYNRAVIKCCLMYKHNNKIQVFERSPSFTEKHYAKVDIMSFHVTCSNARHPYKRPYAVGLTVNEIPCRTDMSSYVKPALALKELGVKLALGTQLAYGNISAEIIIEWMETYKYLGVDKIVTYYYKDLNENALKVLKYYHDSEFLDLYYFIPAAEDIRPRQFKGANYQLFNDLSTIVYDSFEKMSGYTYFGIIDFDEFLIPSKNRSLKEMLSNLHQTYKNAAGFVFMSQYYYLSWGPSGNMNDLIIGSYINRTNFVPNLDRPKHIYMPKYIAPGGAHTHGLKTIQGFRTETAPSSFGYIRHFRQCRRLILPDFYSCLNDFERVPDRSIANWSMRIKDNVHYVRKQIFGTTSPIQ